MTRTYGRSECEMRLVQSVPYGRWQTTTFLGAMRSTGFVAPLCVERAINGTLFQAWVEQYLVKVLRSGDRVVLASPESSAIPDSCNTNSALFAAASTSGYSSVVMDNLSSHKGPRVFAAIGAPEPGGGSAKV